MKKPMQSHTMELPRRIVVGGKNIDGIGTVSYTHLPLPTTPYV